MECEFDETKSSANKDKHGIDFVETQALWRDPDRLEVAARTGELAHVAPSDGAAAAVICSAEKAKQLTSNPVWVAGSAVATMRFDDGLPRGLAGIVPPGRSYHSEATLAVEKALAQAGAGPEDLDFVELQDNTVYYEFAFPEDWGLCKPGEAEHLLETNETLPTGKMPINPSGGFLCFGEATTAMGVFQVCEMTWQLRDEAGPRQVPGAKLGLGQTLGLGGNAPAVVLKR